MREPEYRVTPLPAQWPGKATPLHQRKVSPFYAKWGHTMELLERELRQLQAREVVLAIDVRSDQIRQDGKPKAGARIQNSAVIVSFRAGPDHLSFPCDRFNWWEDNVRAIALALEALRKVDRYGVQQGRQYQGFKALPSAATTVLSVAAAAEHVRRLAGETTATVVSITRARDVALALVRHAYARTHPDRGGAAEDFHLAQRCEEVLKAHFGGSW